MLVNWEQASHKANVFLVVVLVISIVGSLFLGPQVMNMLGESHQLVVLLQVDSTSTSPDTSTLGLVDLRWYDKLLVFFGFTLGALILFVIIGVSLWIYKVYRIKWIPIGLAIFVGSLTFGLWWGYQKVRQEGIYYELLLRFSGWVSNLITFGAQNLLITVLFVGLGALLMRQSMKKMDMYPV